MSLLLLLVHVNVWAQKGKKGDSGDSQKAAADAFFDQEDYGSAHPIYSQLLSLDQYNTDLNYRFGVCELFVNRDKEKALPFLKYASTQADAPLESHFFLGKAYHLNYRFNEALTSYYTFKEKATKAQLEKYDVTHQMEMCRNGKTLLSQIRDLLVLERKEVNQADFFRSYDLDASFGGKVIPMTEEFQGRKDKGGNAQPVMFITASKDEIFISSYGDQSDNLDLYRIAKTVSGEWGKPENLGSVINTPFDEAYPFLHPDGRTLYFASTGHNSMGGFDIFRSTYNEESHTWMPPQNVDFAINTPADDILFAVDEADSVAFFASNRASVGGKMGVFKIRVGQLPSTYSASSRPGGISSDRDSLALSSGEMKKKAMLEVNNSPDLMAMLEAERNKNNKNPEPSADKTPEKEPPVDITSYADLTPDKIIDLAYADADRLGNESKVLRRDADAASMIAEQKRLKAEEYDQMARAAESRVDSETDPVKKEGHENEAEALRQAAAKLRKEYAVALKISQQLDGDADEKNQNAKQATENAQIIEKALKSNSTDEALTILAKQKAKLEARSEKETDYASIAKNAVSELSASKGEELVKKTAYLEALEKDAVDLQKDAAILRDEAGNAKDPDLKKELLAQAGELEKESENKTQQAQATREELQQLQDEGGSEQGDQDLAENIVEEIRGYGQTDSLAMVDVPSENAPERQDVKTEKPDVATVEEVIPEETFPEDSPEVKEEEVIEEPVQEEVISTPPVVDSDTKESELDTARVEETPVVKNDSPPSTGGDPALRSYDDETLSARVEEEKVFISESEKSIPSMKEEAEILRSTAESIPDPKNRQALIDQAVKLETDASKKEQQVNEARSRISTLEKEQQLRADGLSAYNPEPADEVAQDTREVVPDVSEDQTEGNVPADTIAKARTEDEVVVETELVDQPTIDTASLASSEPPVEEIMPDNADVVSTEVVPDIPEVEVPDKPAVQNAPVEVQDTPVVVEDAPVPDTPVADVQPDPAPTRSDAKIKPSEFPATKSREQMVRDAEMYKAQVAEQERAATVLREQKAALETQQNTAFEAMAKTKTKENEQLYLDKLDNIATKQEILDKQVQFNKAKSDLLKEEANANLYAANLPPAYDGTKAAPGTEQERIRRLNELDIANGKLNESRKLRDEADALTDEMLDTRSATKREELAQQRTAKMDEAMAAEDEGDRIMAAVFENRATGKPLLASAERTSDDNTASAAEKSENKEDIQAPPPPPALKMKHDANSVRAVVDDAEYATYTALVKDAMRLDEQAAAERQKVVNLRKQKEENRKEAAVLDENTPTFGETALKEQQRAESKRLIAEIPELERQAKQAEIMARQYRQDAATRVRDADAFMDDLNANKYKGSITKGTGDQSLDYATLPVGKRTTGRGGELNEPKNLPPVGALGGSVAEETATFSLEGNSIYSASNPIPIDPKLPDGLIFKVQIGAFRNAIRQDLFGGTKPVAGERTPSGMIRYTAGLWRDFSPANNAKQDIRNKGFRDAFVVAFYNGKRIPIYEAMAIAKNEKTGEEVLASLNGSNPSGGNRQPSTTPSTSTGGRNSGGDVTANNSGRNTGSSTGSTTQSNNNAPVKTNGELTTFKGLVYTVQVGVYSRAVTASDLNNITPVYTETMSNGLTRYTSGKFDNINAASAAKQEIVNMGIKDAFVIAYRDGKRISLNDAASQRSTGTNRSTNTGTTSPTTTPSPSSSNETVSVFEEINPLETGVVFRVQIGAYQQEVPTEVVNQWSRQVRMKIKTYRTETGITLFTVGELVNYDAASAVKKELTSKGMEGVFVTAYENGKPISLQRAIDLTSK
ncbi:MAG: PD40 domain-containing protein [Flavobacteriales bacterium]|nr:PD40 domain-containing protein [Flavobacteriales bacterium]